MKAVEFRQVSKSFRLHRDPIPSLRATIIDHLLDRKRTEEFWAVRDLNLSIESGELIGFVGANGSGKSTALRLAAHILEPTSGTVITRGRLAALLQLGAGFHPELTGRENVFLFGSFYGMSRRDMIKRLDEIIEFSGLIDFMDQPVKHYSAGMFVRLGFATAMSLNPEILLIDEALAVGDALFNHRCLPRIREMRAHGTTILVVSHSLELVRSLCDRVVWLHYGRAVVGETGRTLDAYLEYVAQMVDQHNGDSPDGIPAARSGAGVPQWPPASL